MLQLIRCVNDAWSVMVLIDRLIVVSYHCCLLLVLIGLKNYTNASLQLLRGGMID